MGTNIYCKKHLQKEYFEYPFFIEYPPVSFSVKTLFKLIVEYLKGLEWQHS
jgi:hypothetical protein